MRTLHGLSLGFALIVAGAAVTPAVATDGEKMSHAHMGHVTTAWGVGGSISAISLWGSSERRQIAKNQSSIRSSMSSRVNLHPWCRWRATSGWILNGD